MKTPSGLVAHARAQLGLPYWYACYGQKPTADLADYKRCQYPEYWTVARLEKAKASQLSAPRVYDCAGLVKSYWMQADPHTAAKYVEKYDKSAAGLKACCKTKGPISCIPAEPGVLVFVGTRHVGIYDGKGRVIEARGFNYGVVERPLSAGSWDSWGKLDWLDYGDKPSPVPAPPKPVPKPTPGSELLCELPFTLIHTSALRTLTFQKGDAVILNGPVFRDSYGSGQGRTFRDYESTITIVAPASRIAPYHVGQIGWARIKDLKKAGDKS
jgi:hypothetical protein